MSKSIEDQKRELDQRVENTDDFSKLYEAGDVAVYAQHIERPGYESYVITSSVHWTTACEVTRQQVKSDKWNISIHYGSGGTLTTDPMNIAIAMEHIFSLANGFIWSMKNKSVIE